MAEEMVENEWDESPMAPMLIPKREHDRLAAAEKRRSEPSPSDRFSAQARAARERDAQDQGLGR